MNEMYTASEEMLMEKSFDSVLMFHRISVLKSNLHCGGIEVWGGNHFVKIGLSLCVSCVSKMLRRPMVTPPDIGRYS